MVNKDLQPLLNELNCWCMRWKGNINAVYGNELSLVEKVQHLFDVTKDILESQINLIETVKINSADITELQSQVLYLMGELEKIANGEYMDIYIDALAKWIDENLQSLVAKIVTYVSFGLSPDGYFVAYIPSTWEFLQFDTIVDYDSPLYGHLKLRW